MILDGRKRENIVAASETIQRGGVVGFPTETVYGLGGDAFQEEAVKKIFKIKNRPFQDPLILHIADQDQLRQIVEEVPPIALKLIEKFWPGPLTLILRKSKKVSPLITAGLDSVAVRWPRNIIATSLIKTSKTILAAPSANKFQSLSPTTAQAVEEEFGNELDIIIDGGPCLIGLESTIISVLEEPEVLRLGGVTLEELETALGRKLKFKNKKFKTGEALVASGLLEFHYAPKKPLKLLRLNSLELKSAPEIFHKSAVICFSGEQEKILLEKGASHIFVLSKSGDLKEAAKNYFEILRKADHSDFKGILCFEVPDEFLGRTINDRLGKAQHS